MGHPLSSVIPFWIAHNISFKKANYIFRTGSVKTFTLKLPLFLNHNFSKFYHSQKQGWIALYEGFFWWLTHLNVLTKNHIKVKMGILDLAHFNTTTTIYNLCFFCLLTQNTKILKVCLSYWWVNLNIFSFLLWSP